MRRFRERRTFGFDNGRRRFGLWYIIRVFLLIAATILLTWYAKTGGNPFAVDRSIRVYGDGGGLTVAATAAEFRKDTVIIGKVAVSGGTLGSPPSPDSSDGAVWKEVYPFADSGDRAVLLTYGGMTAMICDTALFARLRDGGGVRAPFYQKLDILAVPPSNREGLLLARNRFRPRFVVAEPPCSTAPAKNILCAQPGETGRWNYDFTVKIGKIEFNGNY